jgi:hypothetical protein
MGQIAEKLMDLMMLLPEAERRDFLLLVLARKTGLRGDGGAGAGRDDLPRFSGGRWLAGSLDREEIYRDEAGHAMRG